MATGTATARWACMDANEATARVAYALSEVVAIYPITPASPMGEHADDCPAAGRPHLASSVQEAHDFALVSHAATLRCRVPFLHFFDGFRTSHERANHHKVLHSWTAPTHLTPSSPSS